jgi:hypothetical protein
VLTLLQDDGFWLIDAVDEPIDKASASNRREAIERGVPALLERVRKLAPELGIVICHSKVYEIAAPPLRSAGVRIPVAEQRGRDHLELFRNIPRRVPGYAGRLPELAAGADQAAGSRLQHALWDRPVAANPASRPTNLIGRAGT